MFPELVSDLLKDGYSVKFNAPGHSMYPTILANEPVLVEPIDPDEIQRGDIVLYRSNGSLIAHRVMGILRDNAADEYFALVKAFSLDKDHSHDHLGPVSKTGSCNASQGSTHGGPAENLIFILRGDASRTFDEPVKCDQVVGKVISIERNGSSINPYSVKHKFACWLSDLSSRLRMFLGLPTKVHQ